MTPAQIANLHGFRDAMNSNPSLAAAASYYSVLADAGIEYGNMAKGVVLDTTLFGIVANNYMENELVTDRGRSPPGISEVLELQRRLILRDFELRDGAAFVGDLSGQNISDYHDDAFAIAFSGVSTPQEAWTAYHIVRALGPEAWRVSSDLWTPWLSRNGAVQSKAILDAMQVQLLFGNAGQRHHAAEWLNDMIIDGVGVMSMAEWLAKSTGIGRGWFDSMTQKFGSLEVTPPTADSPPTPSFVIRTAFIGWVSSQAELAANNQANLPSSFVNRIGGAAIIDFENLASKQEQGHEDKISYIKKALLIEAAQAENWQQADENSDFASIKYITDSFQVEAIAVEVAEGGVEGTSKRDLIVGFGASSQLKGGAGDDVLFGGGGNDEFEGGSGNDLIIGDRASDQDKASYEQNENQIKIDFLSSYYEEFSTDTLIIEEGEIGEDTVFSVEEILGSENSDRIILSDDSLGRTLIFKAGESGEDGVGDLLDLSNLSMAENFNSENGTIGIGLELRGFEAVIGTDFDDMITGDELRYVEGGEGADQIDTGAEADTLYGGTVDGEDDGASDTLEGGEDTDVYYVSNSDVIRDTDGNGVVIFNGLRIWGPQDDPTKRHGETYTIYSGSTKYAERRTGDYTGEFDYTFVRFDRENIRLDVTLTDGSKITVEDFQNQDFGWTFTEIIRETFVTEKLPYMISWLGVPLVFNVIYHQQQDPERTYAYVPNSDPALFGNNTIVGGAGGGGDAAPMTAAPMSVQSLMEDMALSPALAGGGVYLEGGRGSDEYQIYLRFSSPTMDGEVIEVMDGASRSDVDRIVMADLEAVSTAVRVERDAASLDDAIISFADAADTLLIKWQFLGFGYGVEQIQFADGVVWTPADLRAAYVAQAQTSGNDTIHGFAGDTTFAIEALAGHDVLDEGLTQGTGDHLVFGPSLISADARVSLGGSDPTDVVLTFVGKTGSLVLRNQFGGDDVNGADGGVESIQFGDGVTWNAAQLHATYVAQARTTGNDVFYGTGDNTTFTFDSFAGIDAIVEGSKRGDADLLILAGGLTSADVLIGRDQARPNDLILSLAGSTSSLTILDQFAGDDAGIERIRFADAVEWGDGEIRAAYLAQAQTAGSDTILGFKGSTEFTVAALTGADVLVEGADEAGVDRVVFGSGLTSSTARINRSVSDTDDAVITFVGKTGSVTLDGQFLDNGIGFEQFEFADGVTWNRDDLLAAYYAQTSQTPGNDTVLGAAGNTTYVYAALAGDDVINEPSYKGPADQLIFGGALTSTAVVVTRSSTAVNNATLTFQGQSGSLTLQNEFAGGEAGIEQIRFADNVTWTVTDLRAAYLANVQTAGADTILGFDVNDVINGGGGDDSIRGYSGADTVSGGHGADWVRGDVGTDRYIYGLGDGQDTIYDNGSNSEIDVVELGARILPGDVVVTQADSGRDLVITFLSSPADRIVLESRITVPAGGADQLLFNDGTVWSYAELLIRSLAPTAGHDSLYGDSSDNTLGGAAGNDRLEGRAGVDTYLYDRGDGEDTIYDGASGDIDRVQLGPDITPTDVLVSQGDAGRDFVLTFVGHPTDRLVLDDRILTANGGVDVVRFADGTEWDYAALFERSLASTDQADTLAGDDAANTISGGLGADSLNGRAGADTLLGGAGDDTLDGSTGDDLFLVASADGYDSIVGGSGADTISATSNGVVIGLKGLASVEAISSAGYADVIISGNDAANTLNFASVLLSGVARIEGGGGNDVLTGTAASDVIVGGSGDDTLDGGTGDDTFRVSGTTDGYDSLQGGAGADRVEATSAGTLIGLRGIAGVESISGGGFASVVIQGSASADNLDFSGIVLDGIEYIEGGGGNDTIVGSAGDDVFRITGTTSGFDSYSGGAGVDRIEAGAAGTSLGATMLDNIEIISANGYADVYIVGTSGADTLDLAAVTLIGLDRIDGGQGNDLVFGSASSDVIVGGAGNDTLHGGDGNDVFRASGASQGIDAIFGGAGEDRLEAAAANTALGVSGLAGVEVISASGFSGVYVLGSSSSDMLDLSGVQLVDIDRIEAGGGSDTILATSANDRIAGGAGADYLDGGSGLDTALYSASTSGVFIDLTAAVQSGGDAQGDTLVGFEHIVASGSADTLVGDAQANVLSGAGGNDVLDGSLGADTIDGGAGTDTVTYLASASAVSVNLTTGVHGGGSAAGDSLTSVENLVGSAFGDTLTGSGGSNHINGGAGDDVIDGGSWSDTLVGGLGNDVYTVDSASDQVVEAAGEGIDEVRTALANYALDDHLEKLTYTGTAAFVGTGNVLDNAISGGSANDLLQGGSGADTLTGGSGIDTATYSQSSAGIVVSLVSGLGSGGEAEGDLLTGIENLTGSAYDDMLTGSSAANILVGGGGADTLDGGGGTDTASYALSSAGIVVNLTSGTGSGGDANGDLLVAIENLVGSGFADSLTGSSVANHLDGGAGSDTLDGGAHNDTMVGGAGDDVYLVDSASDAVTESSNSGNDEVRATSSSYTLASNVERLSYVGGGNFTGTGNSLANLMTGGGGADSLSGGSGGDTLQGAAGNDSLLGGAGQDSLTGGSGVDFFDFNGATESGVSSAADIIADFSHADGDRIDLAGIDANSATSGDQAFSFIGTAAFVSGTRGQLRYESRADGNTWVQADLDGNLAADFEICLVGTTVLVAGDFVL